MGSIIPGLVSQLALFAEKAAAPAGQGAQPGDATGGFGQFLPLLIIFFVVFYLFVLRPQRRDQAKRQAMLSAVKKNDRVVTIGGIYGVVTNVRREADEVTIKVDETTNTKLRLTLSSVARVMGEGAEDESDKK
ncbi:MAG: preprotein translocase subunit YajC [Thermoguttaceae bacterium]